MADFMTIYHGMEVDPFPKVCLPNLKFDSKLRLVGDLSLTIH